MMTEFLRDLGFALRVLRRRPGFTSVITLTLTLGIGVTVLVFSLVKGLLFDSPFRDVDRLLFMAERVSGMDGGALSYPSLLEYQRDDRALEELAGFRLQSWNLTGDSAPERLDGLQASSSLFSTLGVRPILGRTFTAEEDRPGGARVVVVSEELWRRRFGADPSVLQRTLQLDDTPYRIVGVMPSRFQIWRRADLFTPLGHRAPYTDRPEWKCIYAVGRLKPRVSPDQARAAMAVVASRLAQADPTANGGRECSLTPMRDHAVRGVRRVLWTLAGVCLLVLVLCCINVAGLLLAHGVERSRELSIRASLGAGRLRQVRPLLAQSLVLALGGAAGGLLLATWGVRLATVVLPRFTPDAGLPCIDAPAVIVAVLLAVVVGITTGSAPAWFLTRRPAATAEAARQGRATAGHTRLQDGLVVAQVALAVVTLTAATLMLHSLLKLMAVPLGLQQQGVVLADLTLPPHTYPDAARVRLFYQEALAQTERIPGVRSAAMMTTAPMSGIPWDASYSVEGQEPPDNDDENECDYVAVSRDYFRTLGIALTEGRAFSDRDDAEAIPVAVVNRAFTARHLAGGSPLGKRLSFPFMGGRSLEIVGAVEDVRRWGPESAPRVTIYVPLAQSPSAIVTLATRTSHAQGLAASMRDALRRVDPNLPLANLRTMAEVVSEASGTRRMAASSLATLGGIALCLSALGLYGALSRRVVSRRREIGIRLALGAQSREILRHFMRRGLWLTAAGAAAGSVISLLLAPLLASLLFGVRPRDPISLVVVLAVMLLAAALATSLPARRAASVDPAVALRGE